MFHNSILILNQGPQVFSSRQQNLRCENFEWWIQRIALWVKIEEQHSTVIPSDSHSGLYFPASDESDGFEATACLECRQVLTVLYMAGRSALKLGTGNCVSYLDIAFQRGKHAAVYPSIQLSDAFL